MDDTATRPLQRWRFENAEFDEALGELRIDGQPVAIEPRPLQLLGELLRHADAVLTKEELLASVWQGRPTVEHVLPSAVNRLRRALGPRASMCIVTLPRQGYRFVGALHSSTAAPAAPAAGVADSEPFPDAVPAPARLPDSAVAPGAAPATGPESSQAAAAAVAPTVALQHAARRIAIAALAVLALLMPIALAFMLGRSL